MSKPRLTVLGDSFVEGRGDTAPDGSFHGWVIRLADQLAIPGSRVCNLGTYQATTQVVVDRQLGRALTNKAPLIGVVCGVNDLVQDYEPVRFRGNLQRIFTALRGQDTTVFTATYPDIPGNLPVPHQFRSLLRGRFAEANAVLADVAADTGTLLLDIAAEPVWAQRELWAADGLHPSPSGHARFARSVADLVHGVTTPVGVGV